MKDFLLELKGDRDNILSRILKLEREDTAVEYSRLNEQIENIDLLICAIITSPYLIN